MSDVLAPGDENTDKIEFLLEMNKYLQIVVFSNTYIFNTQFWYRIGINSLQTREVLLEGMTPLGQHFEG